MAAKPTFTEAARRSQIVLAAIETIAELGFARASYAQIARRAGLSSTGLISYHFAGKDDLIDQVVGEVVAAGQAFMLPRVDAAPPGRARLRAYITSNLEFMRARRDYIVAVTEIFNGVKRARDGQPAPYLERHERGIEQLEGILLEGQEIGELRPSTTRPVATAIRATIDAVAHRLSTDADLDLATHIDELATLFDEATRQRVQDATATAS